MTRKRACDHSEGVGHDCVYVDARNALVPEAAAYADALLLRSGLVGEELRDAFWNHAYHARMAEKWTEFRGREERSGLVGGEDGE